MEIKIGADELILWFRKNGKATQCDNRTIGRRIANLMEKLGGRFGDSDAPCIMGLAKFRYKSTSYIATVHN